MLQKENLNNSKYSNLFYGFYSNLKFMGLKKYNTVITYVIYLLCKQLTFI